MYFILKADCEFTADNLDDAFKLLEEHFRKLREDEDYDETPFLAGEIHIQPFKE